MSKKKDRFIKLHNFDNNDVNYLDPEAIQEICTLPKTNRYAQRTRVHTSNQGCYLVKESAQEVHIMVLTKR